METEFVRFQENRLIDVNFTTLPIGQLSLHRKRCSNIILLYARPRQIVQDYVEVGPFLHYTQPPWGIVRNKKEL